MFIFYCCLLIISIISFIMLIIDDKSCEKAKEQLHKHIGYLCTHRQDIFDYENMKKIEKCQEIIKYIETRKVVSTVFKIGLAGGSIFLVLIIAVMLFHI